MHKSDFSVFMHLNGRVLRQRSLKQIQQDEFKWLAVSRYGKHAGAWCATCVLFRVSREGVGRSCSGQAMGNLVTRPLTEFNKLRGKDGELVKHASSEFHKTNATRETKFVKRKSNPNINVANMQKSARKRELQRNRPALLFIIGAIQLAAIQNISFRGHRDDGRIDHSGTHPPNNHGNFRMLIRFRIKSGDSGLVTHLKESPSNVLYTSKTIQNEILELMGNVVQCTVVQRYFKSP